jgi:hypothetical protein
MKKRVYMMDNSLKENQYAPQIVRAWFREEDQYGGNYNRQFFVDNPAHLPVIGTFIESDHAYGWVTHIQHVYSAGQLIITILLSKDKELTS